MTSWNRGKENEERGERELSDNNPDNNLKGISDKVGGEIEQGIDNIGDTLSGKQNDLQGKDQNWGNRAGDALSDAGQNVGNWVQDRQDDIRKS